MGGKILQWQRVVHVIYDRERIRNNSTCGRKDGRLKNIIPAAENGVINLARNIPKRRCINWLTKYVNKMTVTRKLWSASGHTGCARASFEVSS